MGERISISRSPGILIAGGFAAAMTVLVAQAADPIVLELGERTSRTLAVENGTESDWHIDRVTTSCECLRIDAYPGTVPAGTSMDLMVTVTGKGVGQFVFQVGLYGRLGSGSNRSMDVPVTVLPAVTRTSGSLHRLQLATRERDQDLYIAAAEVLAEDAARQVLDTRPVAAYHQTHIPGSRRRDAQAIRGETPGEIRAILVVDEGWGAAATERACHRLRSRNPGPVHILRGGMAAWIEAGGSISGTIRVSDPASALPAEKFLPLAGFDDWRVLVYVEDPAVTDIGLSDHQVRFIREGAGEAETAQIAARLAEASSSPVRLLVVDENRTRALRHVAAARAAGIDSVCYVSEGARGLAEEIHFHQQTRLASRQTITTINRGDAPETAKGGCSGCP